MLVPGGTRAGIITKPYGLRGEVYSILEPGSAQFIKPDIPLFIEIDGQRVPFFIEEAELVSDDQAILKLEFIESPEDARNVSGCPFFFDALTPRAASDREEDFSELIGYAASDQTSGNLGTITEYLSHPMNPVLVIEAGGNEMMVPAVRDFIEHIDHRNRRVHFNLPDGLTSL